MMEMKPHSRTNISRLDEHSTSLDAAEVPRVNISENLVLDVERGSSRVKRGNFSFDIVDIDVEMMCEENIACMRESSE